MREVISDSLAKQLNHRYLTLVLVLKEVNKCLVKIAATYLVLKGKGGAEGDIYGFEYHLIVNFCVELNFLL